MQHRALRRLENGNITLFDNGNDRDPSYSRALEYEIDEINKTVTRVWQYPGDQSEFSFIMSNVQRLPNGNTFIGWGGQPQLSEVKPDGSLALEMFFTAVSYRAYRFPWEGVPADNPRAVLKYNEGEATAVNLYTSWNGATDIISHTVYTGETNDTLTPLTTVARTGFETEILLTNLDPNTCFFQIRPIHADSKITPLSNMTFRTDLAVCRDQLNFSYMPLISRSE